MIPAAERLLDHHGASTVDDDDGVLLPVKCDDI